MSKNTRFSLRFLLIIFTIIVVTYATLYWWARRPFPALAGEFKFEGISAEVTVIRDEFGVPNIYADNDNDLLFAQGYVHAQDRLWQMEIFRRSAAGTLSEILGKAALDSDIFARNVRMRQTAAEQFAALNDADQALLLAYSDGVNTYMDEYEGKMPLEFQILGYHPEPWSPVDTLSWGNQLSRHLASNRRLEHLRARIVADHGMEAMEKLFPNYGAGTPATIREDEFSQYYRGIADAVPTSDFETMLGFTENGIGSNAFVASGEHTDTGMPILASDLHLGVTMPAGWYANGLHGGSFDVVGYTMPGVPLILTGHNADIAWGPTNLGPDSQDMYMEKVDSMDNPTVYEFKGEMLPVEKSFEVFNIKDRDSVTKTFYATHHGPILHYTLPNRDEFKSAEELEAIAERRNNEREMGTFEYPLALSWTLFEDSRLFSAIVKINRATNWEEFRSASSEWDLPGQNMLYADREGNIGYQATGAIPIRENHTGLLPVPGWTGEFEWERNIPWDEMPTILNPESGMLASANSRIVGDDYPYRISDSYTPGYRLARIYDLMEENLPLTSQKMWDLQSDTYANHSDKFMSFLLDAVVAEGDDEEKALAALRDWDLYMDTDSVGTTVYQAFHMAMLRNLLFDEFGQIGSDYIQGHYIRHNSQSLPMLVELMEEPDHEWWDDIETTDVVETRDDILQRSFEDGVEWLVDEQGSNEENWNWGKLHSTNFPHLIFGDHSVLSHFFNAPRVERPGGNFTVHTHAFIWTRPFDVWIVPIKAEVISLANFDDTMAVGATGQNANLYHPHREDVISLWNDHKSHPLPSSRAVIESRATNTMVLQPVTSVAENNQP